MVEWRDIKPEDHDFTNAKAGDVVYGLVEGRGIILRRRGTILRRRDNLSKEYSVLVGFENDHPEESYTQTGRRVIGDTVPSLFKRPIKIVIQKEDDIDRQIVELQKQIYELKNKVQMRR